jgi:hypothetical protein
MSEDCGCNDKPEKKVTILSRIMNKVFVSEEEHKRRMEICRACDHFRPTLVQCGICGCFLEAKTRLVKFHCALDEIGETPKW